jgi:Zn-dependent M28 family amino/carboxypeptidase
VVESPKLTHTALDYSFSLPVFEVLGAFNESKASFSAQTRLLERNSQNVMAMVQGKVKRDSFLLVTAHYDHLGTMGEAYFPGANDNASGVAMLLELSRHIAQNPLNYSVVFVCFSGEEAGLLGSKHFVEKSPIPLKNIRFLLNLDLIGTGENGATVVNGSVFKEELALLDSVNKVGNFLPKILTRGKAANSDHHYFTEAGVRSFFLYQMGDWPHYHDVNDKPPLPLTRFSENFKLFVKFLEMLCVY